MSDAKNKVNKGARTYLESAVKAASHPIRRDILKQLKKKPLSSVDLEKITGESRYNLYHHISVLEKSNLIIEGESEGKKKMYNINLPENPNVAVIHYEEKDIIKNKKIFNKIFSLLEEIESEKFPFKGKVSEVEIHLKLNWIK
ncbi:MAG: winged helix-turn-helix transcriptional regulator [Candidatus Marinimicrobia bacterium]|nr:winged helix-turn-helix transcriptional regulator [Candidatus Neomarinimicrobiota bacterium]MBT4733488.1 winged helix-turn-helix transcriptional regulator [Candidatus Neomarinimicrobiota bacterium]MBT7901231.1 winged helix-turn-helix transcriptional regulator [Candidatus Neomarinimicrobiota bacterium]